MNEEPIPSDLVDRLPYPIAVSVAAYNKLLDPLQRFERLMVLAEMITRFWGAVAVAHYLRDGARVFRIQYLLSRLASPDWDIWLDLLDAISQHYENEGGDFAVPELTEWLREPFGPESDVYSAFMRVTAGSAQEDHAQDAPGHVTPRDFLMMLATHQRSGWAGLDMNDSAVVQSYTDLLFPSYVRLLQGLSSFPPYRLGYVEYVRQTKIGVLWFVGAEEPQREELEAPPGAGYLELQQVYLFDSGVEPMLGLHPFLVVEDNELHILYQSTRDRDAQYIGCKDRTGLSRPNGVSYSVTSLTVPPSVLRLAGPDPFPGRGYVANIPLDVVAPLPAEPVNLHMITHPPAISPQSVENLNQTNFAPSEGRAEEFPPIVEAIPLDDELHKPPRPVNVDRVQRLDFLPRSYLAEPMSREEEIRPGSLIGRRYKIVKRLGRGPVASVYEAEIVGSRLPDPRAIVKIIDARIVQDVLKDRLEAGVLLWRKLSQAQHPNILCLNDVAPMSDGRLILELDNWTRITLRDLLDGKSGIGLEVPIALNIAVQVARALTSAHTVDLTHGFLKPSNILIDKKTNNTKVTDFGLSAGLAPYLLGSNLTTVDGLAYMPPEWLQDLPMPAKTSDIYELGVLLYEMLTGRLPFWGATPEECKASVLRGEYVPLGQVMPGLPPGLVSIVQRCMQLHRLRRYQRMETVLRQLELLERESRDPVRIVSQYLVDEAPREQFELRLVADGLQGPDLLSRAIQYCLQQPDLREPLNTWFNLPGVNHLCRQRKLAAPEFETLAQAITYLLETAGVRTSAQPAGLAQSIALIEDCLHRLASATSASDIDGMVTEAVKRCELILRNLIRFHSIYLFQDAWEEMLRQEVLGPSRRLLRERIGMTSIGALLHILNAFNNFVSSTAPEARMFQETFSPSKIVVPLPKAWVGIAELRNAFLHPSEQMESKSLTEIRQGATKLVRAIHELFLALRNASTYPRVVIVQKTEADYSGRREARCVDEAGVTHTVHTCLDLRPGEQYFFHSLSDPISVNPILIPISEKDS